MMMMMNIDTSPQGTFQWQFTILTLWYEVGRQHVKALQAAAISPYLTSPTPPIPYHTLAKGSHNTGNFMPYSFRIVCGFFNVPHWTNKHVLKVLPFADVITKAALFYSVILRPWVMVRPKSNSRPPAWQTDAHLTEPPVRGVTISSQIVLLKERILGSVLQSLTGRQQSTNLKSVIFWKWSPMSQTNQNVICFYFCTILFWWRSRCKAGTWKYEHTQS